MLLGIVCLLHCRFWTIIICFFQRWAFCGFFCPCCLGGSREIAHLKLVPQSGPFLPSELQKLMLGSFIAVFLITIAVPAANRVHSIVWKIHCWEWYCWMMKWNYWSNRYGWLCLFFVDGNGYQKNQNLAWPVDHGQGNVEKSRARAFFCRIPRQIIRLLSFVPSTINDSYLFSSDNSVHLAKWPHNKQHNH